MENKRICAPYLLQGWCKDGLYCNKDHHVPRTRAEGEADAWRIINPFCPLPSWIWKVMDKETERLAKAKKDSLELTKQAVRCGDSDCEEECDSDCSCDELFFA